MSQDKHEIIYDVLGEIITEVENEISERFNTIEFKVYLKEKLKERNVRVEFTNMENTNKYGEIELPKYGTSFADLEDDIIKDLIIYND